ncbi:amidohydrolase [Myxococcota bacterium]|nr:amidohydrolase [Myxococcota bacterium]
MPTEKPRTPSDERILLISADCHAGPLVDTIRGYVAPKFRDAFDAWQLDQAGMLARRAEHTGEAIYGDEAMADFQVESSVSQGGMDGAWDSKRRLAEIEQDGIVAEVIFPGGSFQTVSPFGSGLMTYQYAQDEAIWWEGCRSYNRWLADFCSEVKGRRAGVGLITIDDIPRAVAEVKWLRENGVFGGIVLPVDTNGQPFYNHPRYEPLWSVCEELGMPIHTHSGWTPNYGRHDGSLGIFLYEITWFAHRPFHFLIWSGVFERHPRLKFVMTEQGSSWVIGALQTLDAQYELPMFRHLRRKLPRKPSEYYHQNVFIGAAFMDDTSAAQRYEIGVDKLMWGSDYPHIEGTWPHTAEKLKRAFANVPRDEAAKMLGGTAARVYGFDVEALTRVAAQIGPTREQIGR